MIRDTGNEHIENRNWELANMEYEFVVNLYNYEVLNRYTDLVDSLEITAEQWDEMDEQLLFCHTNSAYCYLEIAKYEIDVENKRKAHLKTVPEGALPRETVAALEKVLEHGRLAAQCKPNDSAKALYRMSQAFLIKEDYIEALDCLSKANETESGNVDIRTSLREVKSMPELAAQQQKAKAKASKVFGSLWRNKEMKHAMDESQVVDIKERLLLMELLLDHGSAPSASEMRVFKTVKYFGKDALEGDDWRLYEDMFKRAKNKLTKDQLVRGQQLGIYITPDEEHIFGPNTVYVAQHQRLPPDIAECKDPNCGGKCMECKEVIGLMKTLVDNGGIDSFSEKQIKKLSDWGLIVTSQWETTEVKPDNSDRISCRRPDDEGPSRADFAQ